MNAQITVFVVDDDRAVRESLALLVQSVGLEVETFAGAGEFLDAYRPDRLGCLITDIRMPGMSGLELQERLTEDGYHIPVIVLTGFGDVPAAVRALKGGAVDFVEKPFNPQALLDLVQQALVRDTELREQAAREADLAERMALLTPREREIMALVVAGKANKVIAIDLSISERTVELHRGRIMKKMQARSVAELMRIVLPPGGDEIAK
ncbi:MAG: response regulator transcription factor [Gammaproteobacteria bacterium]|nr:response regulator transcription factor [Gammaproteobacteria bacterium]MDX2462070.1 response regulator transcription factor [Gammaproteobacteria bacterium]